MSDVEYDNRAIKAFMRALADESLVAKVGILGDHDHRREGDSNASIGLKHEFGDPSENLPQRSFLRQPLAEQFSKTLDKSEAFTEDSASVVIKTGSMRPWLERVAIVAEEVVREGFATGGFGKWRESNMARKRVHQTLVETQQLRNSITSEVK